ncbi:MULTISPECIES: cytosine permease [unclassified Roseateles]|uniref:purine-cytosine permease family protein n=1 Tax=unclassified Roseateles TaxID=2626991 RepID=UPI000700E1DE|nr:MULTISPECIES: cytosine permease [unclassified Roseateles]KQW44879.1 nitrate reductase [Pelomonas sp. Root405]KRA70238.1 nitrate reductase [Pelomonas sp. Root662]
MSRITDIEAHSFEQIPASARQARPVDLFRLLFGGCNTFSTSVLGSFPILVGLSFRDGACAITVGLLVGAALLAPMSLFGPRNGTNDPVSSGAHFGIRGRLVGSFLLLLTAIAFFSLAVWSSGDALVGGAHAFMSLPVTPLTLSLAYAFFAALVVVICIYGFQFMLWVNKIAVWAASLLFLLALLAFAPSFDPAYAGSLQRGDAAYWPAVVASATVAASNPLSFASTLGDWGRYIPAQTPRHRLMAAVLLAQGATLLPLLFGLCTATLMAVQAPQYIQASDYIGGLIAISPGWLLLPVCLIAIVGGVSTGTTALYGSGLDVASMLPRHFSRAGGTLAVGLLSVAIIFLGRFVFNLVESVSTFATVIGAATCPWLAIMVIGFVTRRGHYLPGDLQVFNRGRRGGHYSFTRGWNLRAMVAWWVATLLGLLFAQVPGRFTGPLNAATGGLDLSLPVSLVAGGGLYLALLWRFPEPDAVYGPRGRLLVPAGTQGANAAAPRSSSVSP